MAIQKITGPIQLGVLKNRLDLQSGLATKVFY